MITNQMDGKVKTTEKAGESDNSSSNNASYVVADIGGTNARFAVYSPGGSGKREYLNQVKFRCKEFRDLSDAFQAYLDLTGHEVSGACISIAAPADGDRINMTNLNWTFSIDEYKRLLGLKSLLVINDGVAAALATTAADASTVEQVKPGQVEVTGSRLNLIPGTGFGLGCVVPHDGQWVPVKSEGGHATLAAVTDEEFAVLKHITGIFGRAVSDRVLSGPGMLSLYQSLAAVRGQQAMDFDAKEMTKKGIKRSDELCADALDLYCTLLGRLAGDLSLTLDAHGGVYLSGSLLKRVGVERLSDCFNSGFTEKGRMSEKVDRIPVKLLRIKNQCLLGASVWIDTQIAAGKLAG